MIKNIIKNLFYFLGYKVHKINKSHKIGSSDIHKTKERSKYTVQNPLDHNTSRVMNDFFSDKDNLDKYVAGRQVFYNVLAKKVTEECFTYTNPIIVDVGCGPGDLLNKIFSKINDKNINGYLYGFDHSEKLIEIGNNRFPKIKFLQFDLFADFKNHKNEFDLVICSEVIEHLLNYKNALCNLLFMVKRSGCLIITVPEGRADTYLGHINFWSPESWGQLIREVCEDDASLSYETDVLEANSLKYNFAKIKLN